MKLVVDAEVIFAALIAKGFTFKLIKTSSDSGYELITPDYLLDEIERRKSRILKFSKMNEIELDFVLELIFKRVKIVKISKYKSHLKNVTSLSPHPIDIPYFALAKKFKAGIWSNEKGFKKQTAIKIYSTQDLKKIISNL